jgi:protein gp37
MYRDKNRYGQDPATVIRSKPATFNLPLKWKEPAKVFICSWSDFFIKEADPWRDEAWEIIRKTPHLTYQILTKRPENIAGRLPVGWPFKNVWLGVTAENQEVANKRIPILFSVHGAPVLFVSVEPMVGEVDLTRIDLGGAATYDALAGVYQTPGVHEHADDNPKIHWVICGGESGPEARIMEKDWAGYLKAQCAVSGTPFFMKQMSAGAPIPEELQGQAFPEVSA